METGVSIWRSQLAFGSRVTGCDDYFL
jgi:hypothetical protein